MVFGGKEPGGDVMKCSIRIGISVLTVLLLALPLLVACDDDDGVPTVASTSTIGEEPEDTLTSTSMPTVSPEQTAEPTPEPTSTETSSPNNPIPHMQIPQHPFLAPNGRSNMHNDAYMSDTYEIAGPAGIDPQVILRSYAEGPNSCATITFDTQGRILTTNGSGMGFGISLLDPDTLDVLAYYPLPPRDPKDPLFPYEDTSGAVYFVFDNQERILFTDTENAIQIIRYSDEKSEFEQLFRFDLSEYVVPMEPPASDHVQMTIPDWEGELLWFTTRYGIVGTVDQDTGDIHSIELEGEELQNSFAVGEDGVYILSDHAMYRFNADEDGTPVADWRTAYDRGTRVKPSMMNQGSGTTPQLFGNLVAIGDNAEPRMNILFLERSDGSEVCRIPVFDDGLSTTENALPGLVREGDNGLEYSVIVDNNYGIERNDIFNPGSSWENHEGGLVRIDLLPDGKGGYTCEEIWKSPVKSSNVLPKLSLVTGLLYLYTYEYLPDDVYTWYLTTVDFETGETVFSIPTGTGLEYANFGQPMYIAPDGAVYLGTMFGLLRIRDTAS